MKFRELYRVDDLPVFQNRMYDSEASAQSCTRGNMRLAQDLETGLISNIAFDPNLVVYDSSYQNEQGVSPLFQSHLSRVADIIESHLGKKNIVEVGCGKGGFLELLLSRGFDVQGFDPTYEGSNARVRKHYFTSGLNIKSDGIVLRHVLEHIADPVGFLFNLRDANGGQGRIYIEVPCLDWISTRRTWFDVFYEHVNYFRLGDFYRMFEDVIFAEHSFGGQYLSVVADLGSLRRPVREANDLFSVPEDFTRTLQVRSLENSVVWGGASKGVLFCLFMERQKQRPEFVIDINPAKQGKFLPATGIRVSSPEQALPRLAQNATIYVMNSNYLDEVRTMSGNAFKYVGVDHGIV